MSNKSILALALMLTLAAAGLGVAGYAADGRCPHSACVSVCFSARMTELSMPIA